MEIIFNSKKILDESKKENDLSQKFEKTEVNRTKTLKITFTDFLQSYFFGFNILLWVIFIIDLVFFYYDKSIINIISFSFVLIMIIFSGTNDLITDIKTIKENNALFQKIENNYYIVDDSTNLKNYTLEKIKDFTIAKHESQIFKYDYIFLKQGDVVPCDSKIIKSHNLYVNNSTLTGESENVFKSEKINTLEENILNIENILISGTEIISGYCIALVLNVGEENYSQYVLKIAEVKKNQTRFDKDMRKITIGLMIIITVLFALSLLLVWLKTNDISSGLLFALSFSIAITPETLPAIISMNLRIGKKKFSKSKIIVKNNSSIQITGSVDTMFCDKTGTLTEDRLTLDEAYDYNFNHNEELINLSIINAENEIGASSKIDEAIIRYAKDAAKKVDYQFIEQEQFEYHKKLTSTTCIYENKKIKIYKGALEVILKMANRNQINDSINEFSELDKNNFFESIYKKHLDKYSKVIGIAKAIDDQIIFLGIVSFNEEIKASASEVIQNLKELDIDIKILTGDNYLNSKKVLDELKISFKNHMTGEEFEKNKNNIKNITSCDFFTNLSPEQKLEIIKIYQKAGKIVSFLGDGVNDAPSLRKADVGLSVNNASIVAKSCSDAIILEKKLTIIDNFFEQGRHTFSNALKYVTLSIASNFGLIFGVIIATAIFNFEPISPMQLLIQNLAYDVSNIFFVYDKVDREVIQKPNIWNFKRIIVDSIFIGLTLFLMSLLNVIFLLFAFGFNQHLNDQTWIYQFQTCFFLETLISHFMMILIFRTSKLSFIKSNADFRVYFFILLTLLIVLPMIYVESLAKGLEFVKPNNLWYLYMLGSIMMQWCISEALKPIMNKLLALIK